MPKGKLEETSVTINGVWNELGQGSNFGKLPVNGTGKKISTSIKFIITFSAEINLVFSSFPHY